MFPAPGEVQFDRMGDIPCSAELSKSHQGAKMKSLLEQTNGLSLKQILKMDIAD